MDRIIDKLMRSLYLELGATWNIVVLTCVLGELDVIPNGLWTPKGHQFEFYVEVVNVLMIIVCVPLSLKLFSLNTQRCLRRMDKDDALSSYHLWSLIRIGLLLVCMEIGVLTYYLLLDTKGLLCAGIALIASFFCVPSTTKVKAYLTAKEDESLEDMSADEKNPNINI